MWFMAFFFFCNFFFFFNFCNVSPLTLSGRVPHLGCKGGPAAGLHPGTCFGGEIWWQWLLERLWGVTPAPFSPLSLKGHQDTHL